MEHEKILNFLNEASDCKFVTRKWNIDNDQPNANYQIMMQEMKLSIKQKF